ncbi:hypothetical protein VTN31DRAFT_824 [Thermomyces dupontii]|uniref:uncharacterized protein n=1 Tax=Talaromyces thermophilus TaxID=28565 RepID=UPI003741F01A
MSASLASLFTFSNLKSLLIFFGPVLLPKAINAYRNLRAVVASRPPPRPLPPSANRALNVLFAAIIVFLTLSLPIHPFAPDPNVFRQTGSRLDTPVGVIFSRLARHRPGRTLTEADTLLQEKLTSLAARKIYLRFGPDALISCAFCTPGDFKSSLLFYLPLHSLLPHLLHLSLLGLVTSAPFAGVEAGKWRRWFTTSAMVLAAIDIYVMCTFDPVAKASPLVLANQIPPPSLFHNMSFLRPLSFAVFDAVCAALIYLSATGRFFFSPPSPAEQVDEAVGAGITALSNALKKLHGLSVTRNAVVRDNTLKARDDIYWRTVVAMESSDPSVPKAGSSIWEEEEVARAISRVMQGRGRNGGLDLTQLRNNAGEFVDNLTAGLEDAEEGTRPSGGPKT